MKREYDTIVLGLGGIGAGALYWLARRMGGDVLGLEQFALGHDKGGSQDHSRIIRYSYHLPGYVRLAERAYSAWEAVEADIDQQLVYRCGGLDLFPEHGAISPDHYIRSLESCSIPYEKITANEIRHRWPVWRIPDSVWGLFQSDGGLVAAAKANSAHLEGARLAGARIRDEAPVTNMQDLGGEIAISAGGRSYRTRRLVIAAGAWTNDLLAHIGLQLPLTVHREQVAYYNAADLAPFGLDNFPVWIWMDTPCFYGFPVFGEPAVKVAEDVGGYETTANSRNFEPDPAGLARMRRWCERFLPDALGAEPMVKTCLYTLTPDRDFVVDTIPDHPAISVAVGAGHAFKFASALGQILSELALDGETLADLADFAIDRAILQEVDPPKSFRV